MSTARSTSCAFLVTALRCAVGTTTATMQRAHLFSAEFLVRRSDCDDLGIMPRVMNRQREKMEKEELIIFKKKSITVQVRHRRRSTFFSQAQAAMFFFFLQAALPVRHCPGWRFRCGGTDAKNRLESLECSESFRMFTVFAMFQC